MPRPETKGLGSCIAINTFLTLASINASTHGGVLPVCEQGSNVTYTSLPSD